MSNYLNNLVALLMALILTAMLIVMAEPAITVENQMRQARLACKACAKEPISNCIGLGEEKR